LRSFLVIIEAELAVIPKCFAEHHASAYERNRIVGIIDQVVEPNAHQYSRIALTEVSDWEEDSGNITFPQKTFGTIDDIDMAYPSVQGYVFALNELGKDTSIGGDAGLGKKYALGLLI
jgi:hypothetical protein